jgi:hypothetical protein
MTIAVRRIRHNLAVIAVGFVVALAGRDWPKGVIRRRQRLPSNRVHAVAIDLRHMRYTIAAADYRSLRRAAETLHLKQSTLSRCVRELEEELKAVLFERSRARVKPTPAGAAFITSARRVIHEVI